LIRLRIALIRKANRRSFPLEECDIIGLGVHPPWGMGVRKQHISSKDGKVVEDSKHFMAAQKPKPWRFLDLSAIRGTVEAQCSSWQRLKPEEPWPRQQAVTCQGLAVKLSAKVKLEMQT